MAFTLQNLSVLAYAHGFTLWHYKAPLDKSSVVNTDGYFQDAGDMLAAGDMMMVSGRDGGRMLCVVPGQSGVQTVAMS